MLLMAIAPYSGLARPLDQTRLEEIVGVLSSLRRPYSVNTLRECIHLDAKLRAQLPIKRNFLIESCQDFGTRPDAKDL
jgi:hypothetical protein